MRATCPNGQIKCHPKRLQYLIQMHEAGIFDGRAGKIWKGPARGSVSLNPGLKPLMVSPELNAYGTHMIEISRIKASGSA